MSAAAPQIVMSSTMPAATMAGAAPVTYAAAPGAVTYAAPTTTSYAAGSPTVTYGAAMPQVTYAAGAPAVTYAASPTPMEPTTVMQPQAAYATAAVAPAPVMSYSTAPAEMMTQGIAAPAVTYGATAGTYTLQPAASMVAYPGAAVAGYFPSSVKQAWDNHFDAFGKQDLDKIMLDYDETSVARVYDNTTGQKTEFRGTAQIRQMFTNLFADLKDLTTLDAPVVDVEEDGKQVFLVWKCPGCGYKTATDTFIFGPDYKIKRQNIVVTKEAVAAVTSTPAAPVKVSSEKAEKKVSSKKKASKKTTKKSKGIC
mmetsp:Transcript_148161/g.369392  ORF Transcript_148161/g.369392 Transcript_148161/m.369392 type:complete len:311 (+) Transcript_148161:65-997(+)